MMIFIYYDVYPQLCYSILGPVILKRRLYLLELNLVIYSSFKINFRKSEIHFGLYRQSERKYKNIFPKGGIADLIGPEPNIIRRVFYRKV